MALIPVHFTITQSLRIDNGSGTAIPQGSMLKLSGLDSDGNPLVALASGTDTVVGIAGDNYLFNVSEDTTNHIVGINSNDLGYAADLVVGAQGQRVRTMNRINDLYKDTMASGLMTVYSGAGVFRTTRFVTGDTYTPGLSIYLANPATAENNGKISTAVTTNTKVGQCLMANTAVSGTGGAMFESGVPGTDIRGSMSLGNFVTFQIAVG